MKKIRETRIYFCPECKQENECRQNIESKRWYCGICFTDMPYVEFREPLQ